MAYSIIIGGELEFPLATISGWRNLKKWAADNLNADEHAKILHFIEFSWVQDLAEFESQIADVVNDSDGIPSDVESTFSDLLESLGKRKKTHASAFISDGMTSKRIEEGWQVKEDEPAGMLNKAASVDWGNYP